MHITQQLQTLYEMTLTYLTILNTKQAVTLGKEFGGSTGGIRGSRRRKRTGTQGEARGTRGAGHEEHEKKPNKR